MNIKRRLPGNIPPVGDCLGKFRFGFRRQNFVGIENKNPFVAKLQVLECPILFLRPGTIEFELHHFGAVLLGDRDSPLAKKELKKSSFRLAACAPEKCNRTKVRLREMRVLQRNFSREWNARIPAAGR